MVNIIREAREQEDAMSDNERPKTREEVDRREASEE